MTCDMLSPIKSTNIIIKIMLDTLLENRGVTKVSNGPLSFVQEVAGNSFTLFIFILLQKFEQSNRAQQEKSQTLTYIVFGLFC